MALPKPLADRLIGLSVSDNEDLLNFGFSVLNLSELSLRMIRTLLGAGASIAYGGVLRVDDPTVSSRGDFTETIRSLARVEMATHPVTTGTTRLKTPFVNYQAWPLHLTVTSNVEQRDRGVCAYVRIDDRPDPGLVAQDQPFPADRLAHALSRMRRVMAAETNGIIVVGGKTAGFLGIMPGVLEEALYYLEARTPSGAPKPAFFVGGFGGAARVLAEAILGSDDAHVPAPMDIARRAGKIELAELLKGYPSDEKSALEHDVTRAEAERSYSRLRDQLQRVRRSGIGEGLGNGLDDNDNRVLMTSRESAEIVRLIKKGLEVISNR